MTDRTCPIGIDNCYKCEYRQEVNDCGYQEDNYEQALQQAAKRSLIEIEGQGKHEPTLLFGGAATVPELAQAMFDKALGKYYEQGFSLRLDEPNFILRHEHHIVFMFGPKVRPTIQAIHTACAIYLKRKGGENA